MPHMLHLFYVFRENKDSDNCAQVLEEEGCVVDIMMLFVRGVSPHFPSLLVIR